MSKEEWTAKCNRMDTEDAHVCRRLREACGLELNSVYDLINKHHNYPQAIPTLLELLDEVHEPNIKEGIVRALADKSAEGIAAPKLIEEFRRTAPSNSELGWVIGYVLGRVARAAHAAIILELVANRRYGLARRALPDALRHCDRDALVRAIPGLLKDPDAVYRTLALIQRRKLVEVAQDVKRIADGPAGDLQRDAQRVYAKLMTPSQ